MPVGHVSAILAEKLSVSIGVHPQLVTLITLCSMRSALCYFLSVTIGENLRLKLLKIR